MRIKITADSTCDLSPELIRENDIEFFSLFINMGDKSYLDGVTCLLYTSPSPRD